MCQRSNLEKYSPIIHVNYVPLDVKRNIWQVQHRDEENGS